MGNSRLTGAIYRESYGISVKFPTTCDSKIDELIFRGQVGRKVIGNQLLAVGQ